MTEPNRLFLQARLKHAWALHRIKELKAHWDAFLRTDFCSLSVQDRTDGPGQCLQIAAIRPLPAEIPLALGDAIHNLRSSLDFAISELLGWKNTRLTFPMAEEKDELVSSFRTSDIDPCPTCGRGGKGKGRNAVLELAVPGFGSFITEVIKPYKSAGGYLWPLNKLDVRDKHRLLVPIVVPLTVPDVYAVDERNNSVCGTLGISGYGTGSPVAMAEGLKIERYGKPTAELFFNELGIIENEMVFPTLTKMVQAAAETVDSIETFVVSAGRQKTA